MNLGERKIDFLSQQALKSRDRNFCLPQILFDGIKSQSLYEMLKCVEKSRKICKANLLEFIEKKIFL